jgi:tRNA(fMet)-specific endonuclease VapC
MAHLVDSDIMIYRLNNDPPILALLTNLVPQGISMTVISYMEVLDGLQRVARPRAAETRFNRIFQDVPILPFDVASARRCAILRDTLTQQGKRVRPRALDLITASIAMEHGLTLVTRNTADYADIPGLMLYEW